MEDTLQVVLSNTELWDKLFIERGIRHRYFKIVLVVSDSFAEIL